MNKDTQEEKELEKIFADMNTYCVVHSEYFKINKKAFQSFLKESRERARADERYRPEWIVRLQVTHPFRAEGFVDRAIKTVLAQDLDSAFIALPEFDTFWYMDPDGVPQRITTDTSVPRARRTPIYREVGGLFSMVRRSVLERGLLYGERG